MLSVALSLLLLVSGSLQADLQQAVARAGIDRTGLGVMVGPAGGGATLAIGRDTPRTPASNQKILTAALALHTLGADFRFRTIFARGPEGSLVVVGDGDPNMSGRFFDDDPNAVLRAFARDLKKEGVTALPGGILLDATRFDDQFIHPDWPADQLDRWYSAPVAALVFNDSCWDFKVLPTAQPGGRPTLDLQPSLIKPKVTMRCRTVGAGSRRGVKVLHDGEGGLVVQGNVIAGSAGEGGHLAVEDPVVFFGRALRAALIAEGIEVGGKVRRGHVEDAEELLVYRSTLRRSLRVMLTNSQNLYAECIFKRAGGGSFASADESLRAALAEMKVPTGGLVVRDGSGLSAQNRVAPATLFGVLQALRDQPAFIESLPSGGTGTLRKRYKNLGERVRAKTGTINGVKCLSGYVEGVRGKRYVFVVLANGRSVKNIRTLQDLIVQVLARQP